MSLRRVEIHIVAIRCITLLAAVVLLSAGKPAAAREAGPQMMPPHPSLLERLQAEGYDSATVVNLRRVMQLRRAQGIDQPRPISAPVTGTRPALVLLVDFGDFSHQAGATPSVYSDLLFSVDTRPAPGSMRDFYRKASYGLYDISPAAVDSAWRTASQTRAYYAGANYGMGTYPQNAQKLVEEAVKLADPYVNFASYAAGGEVQGLFVIHAGAGAEVTYNSLDIWSHQWYLYPHAVFADGVIADMYSIEPEYVLSPGDSTIGIFAHEYGHVLGMPDLYDTDYSSAGLGAWSLMAFGAWNGPSYDGGSPAFPDAYCRTQLGWITPQAPATSVTGASIPAVETNPTVYRLWTYGASGSEYFLLENRQQTDFDQYLPGAGLLLYHVDESVGNNDNEWHPLVMLEQADAWWDLQWYYNDGDAGDPFPGTSNVRSITASTAPDTRSYAGADTQVSILSISNSGTTMTADLAVAPSVTGTAIGITDDPQKRQADPAVDGYRILWSDERDANYGIAMCDMATGQSRWVAQGSFTQVLSSIYGSHVTWLDDRAGPAQFHTMLLDLTDDYQFQVSRQPTPSTDPSLLWPTSVSDSLVAYSEPNGAGFDLYLYDLNMDSNHNGAPNWRADAPRPRPRPARPGHRHWKPEVAQDRRPAHRMGGHAQRQQRHLPLRSRSRQGVPTLHERRHPGVAGYRRQPRGVDRLPLGQR